MPQIILSYNLQRSENYQVAEFPTEELFKDYKKAEDSNFTCTTLYYRYQAARSLEDRFIAAYNLDNGRYTFFKQWKEQHKDFYPETNNPIDTPPIAI